MSLKAIEHEFTGATTPYASYDSSKTSLGKWITQKSGTNNTDNWAGPFDLKVARTMESSNIASSYPYVIDIGNNNHWVFTAECSTAAATRRIILCNFDTLSKIWTFKGYITLTFPTATSHTIRGLQVQRHLHITGTVAVSGTAVTGTSTTFSAGRIAAGARIGFGSTDPTAITNWYYISSISSDTSITLSTTIDATISAGSTFVIEELRVYVSTTNATAANGGLFVAKGINYDDFISSGTTVAAAISTDNVKAVYWLADASVVTNTIAISCNIDSTATNTNQDIYIPNANTTTSCSIYKYNGRAALTVVSGKSTDAFVLKTGSQVVVGTMATSNGSKIFTTNHGPGSGISCLYFVTTSRIHRVKLSKILNNSSFFVEDFMIEIPPGGGYTFVASSALSSIDYDSTIDKLIILTAAGNKHYVTCYQSTGNQFENCFLCNNISYDWSASQTVPTLNNYIATSVFMKDGIMYFSRISTTAATVQLYAIPSSCDADYVKSTNSVLITPEILTPNCLGFSKVFSNSSKSYGSEVMFYAPEPYRIFCRTNGISDNSGSWTEIDESGDISFLVAAPSIQFRYEFKLLGTFCLSSRIYSLIISYNQNDYNNHFQFSVRNSNTVNKRFAWRFSTAYGSTVPSLSIKLYDAITNSLILEDTTSASLYGVWQKSTDSGTTWGSYNTTDKTNETTYIRYTPTAIADNVKIKSILI